MVQHLEHRADLPAVAGDRDPGAVAAAGEDVVHGPAGAAELRLGRLALGPARVQAAPPEPVALREALLEPEPREQRGDVGPPGARVAGAGADALAEALAHRRREGPPQQSWVAVREAAERQVRRRRAPRQRAGVERLRRRLPLHRQLPRPEVRRLLRLRDPRLRQVRVPPRDRLVAVQQTPVALRRSPISSLATYLEAVRAARGTYIPGGRPEVIFGRVVEPLAVPRHEQDLVLGVLVGIPVQSVDVMFETLPQRLLAVERGLTI